MIYLDNAATTRMAPQVREAMLPCLSERFGNPSSLYSLGTKSRETVDEARKAIGQILGADGEEIYFTGSGTEADNWALKSAALDQKERGRHIITSKIEHHAVLHTCRYLEEQGYEVTYLDVDEWGIVKLSQLERAIRRDTVLISVMAANNEIGTIQPLGKIGQIAEKHGILFHTDAVQAFGQIPLPVKKLGISLLSASAHKIYGPKGVGFLYIKKGVGLSSFIHGGAQEKGRRAGTENTAGIAGFGRAAELAGEEMKERGERERKLRDYLIRRVLGEIPYSRLNGHPLQRLPGNANFGFRFVEGEALLILLDMEGICVSTGSACTSGSSQASHVLLALGLSDETAHGSLRVTLGRETTGAEIDRTVEAIKRNVAKLRSKSPAYADFLARQRPRGSSRGIRF